MLSAASFTFVFYFYNDMTTPLKARNSKQWRTWLEKNHSTKPIVWLVCAKKNAVKPTLSHDEAVDEALCFGWIDGTARSLDNDYYLQSFTPRKPRSVWSKISKAKVQQLVEAGLMMPSGYASIEVAKNNGYWSILDDVEELVIPDDLQAAFKQFPRANAYFEALNRSGKKRVLQWLKLAKRMETRQQRIQEVVNACNLQQKPKPLA